MADPGTWALVIGGVSAGAATLGSYQQAQFQNEQLRAGYASQQRSVSIEQRMIREQESVEKYKVRSEAAMIRARIRVTAGESGLGDVGSVEALLRQTDYDQALNERIISRNAQSGLLSASAGVRPLGGQMSSPFLTGLSTGIQGFATGLQIGSDLSGVPAPGKSGLKPTKGGF